MGISFALKTVYPSCRMSGMGSALCKAFGVDIARCELATDRGCYRQEIGQLEEEGPVFVLNTMGDVCNIFLFATDLNHQGTVLERNSTQILQTWK